MTQQLQIHTGDEMEFIADNVNKLLEYIRKSMLNISANSKQLNDFSKHVVDHLFDAELNISDASAIMEQMSPTMEETSASLNQVSEMLKQARIPRMILWKMRQKSIKVQSMNGGLRRRRSQKWQLSLMKK